MNSVKLLFLLIAIPLSPHASNLDYVKKIDTQLQQQLISKGDQIIQAIYSGADLSAIKVFDLIASKPKKKKNFLKKLIKKDITLALKKSNASESQKAERREYLSKILAIIWKLHDLGEKQGVTGSSVSYKLVDDGAKLYRFLRDYVTLAKQHSSTFAYDRNPKKNRSSHYTEESPESQFGIDMRFYANQSSLELLPHSKKHLLFGKLVFKETQHPNLLFVKFEEYGIGALSEKIAHGFAYLKYKASSQATLIGKRIENVVLPHIIESYLAIVKKVPKPLSSKIFLSTPRSIKTMIDSLNALAKEQATFQKDQQTFLSTLKKQYPDDGDNIRWRSGNEVILKLPS